jgi:hypothetical protein
LEKTLLDLFQPPIQHNIYKKEANTPSNSPIYQQEPQHLTCKNTSKNSEAKPARSQESHHHIKGRE